LSEGTGDNEEINENMEWVTLSRMNMLFNEGSMRGEEPLRFAHHVAKGGRIVSTEHVTSEDAPLPWNMGDLSRDMQDEFRSQGLRGPSVG